MVKDISGNEEKIEPGFAFEIEPGSDAWVIGDEPCIALDFIPINDLSKRIIFFKPQHQKVINMPNEQKITPNLGEALKILDNIQPCRQPFL